MGEPPQKRFRYETYNQQINNIAVDTGKTKPLAWQDEDEAGPSTIQITPFTSELERLSQLDLTLPYQELSRSLQPLTPTLPITLLNIPKIASIFHEFYANLINGQDLTHSGLDSALQLHRAIFETTLGEAVPYAAEAVTDITRVAALSALDPKLVERAYSTLSLILRSIASPLLKPDLTSQQALSDTWAAIRPYLSTNHKRYVRRCVADAWIGVVRKARGDGLQRLTKLLLQDDTEGMEAVWAHSLRGTSGQLHSRAVPIFEILLDDLIANPTPARISTVSKVTTALTYHTTSATITPIVEAIIKRTAPPSSDLSSANAILRILSTALFTRKGKRYPESLLRPTMLRISELFDSLDNIERGQEWREGLMQAVVGSLMAGKLAQWLGPGVTMIERYWDKITAEERFAFTNALIKLRWTGVEQFIIPHIARTVLPSLTSDPFHALVLLNNLAEAGLLSGSLYNVQGGRWRQSLIDSLTGLIERLIVTGFTDAEARRVLGQILHLLSSMATTGGSFSRPVMKIINTVIKRAGSDCKTAWESQGVWNDAHLLAGALADMEGFINAGTAEDDGLVEMLQGISTQWYWNSDVMARVASLCAVFSSEQVSAQGWAIDHLYPNLLSADSTLSLSTLRIIAITQKSQTASSSVGPSTSDIWQACLAVESAEMSLKNVRERTTQIARLGRLTSGIPSGENEETVSRIVTYLISQHKVNFRPLYPETIKALSEIGQSHGDTVWNAVWAELEKVSQADNATLADLGYTKPIWAITTPHRRASQKVEEEEEPEYRCHNAEKMVTAVVDSWLLSSSVEQLDSTEVSVQVHSDRLDVLNYEAQLLGTLGAITSVAEKHTRVLVPAFFAIANQLEDSENATLSAHLSTRQRQQRTANWMELFAKFVNPKAAFRSPELHALYLRILSKGDVKLQGLAVSCLLTYKSPKLTPYEENLRNLLEESKFRDELARFALGTDSEAINETHRDEVIPVVIRLLYGILTARRGRSSSSGLAARKRAVLTALSGCSAAELSVLIDLMLEPFEAESGEFSETAGRQQLGYLSLLADVLKHLAPQTVEYWPRLIKTTVDLIGRAQAQIDREAEDAMEEVEAEDVDDEEVEDAGKGAAPVRHVRSTGIKRIVQFLRARVDFDFKPFLDSIFSVVISPRLAKLDVENTQAPSGILDLIAAIAALPDHATALVECDDRTLPQTFACLTAVKVKPGVIARVFDIIESLLERDTPDILLKHVRPLLDNVIRYVESRTHTSNDDLMRRLLAILSKISVIVTDGQQAQQLATLLCPMLRQAGKQQPEKMKIHVLDTLRRLLTISPDFSNPSSDFFMRSYDLLSNLLQTVFMPATRRAVVSALETFAIADPALRPTFETVADLNAYSSKRLEEPDFDRRLTAFAKINDAPQSELPQGIREWAPLLRSALFFIKDPEELSLRTNSSALLKRFIDLVGKSESGVFVDTVNHTILPGLRQSLRSRLELVRSEAIVVIDHAVKICDGIPSMVELRPLSGDDDDTSFFVNISHIQVHRRARALRRLRDVAATNDIRESTIANIFLPILEHIIAGSTEVTDHHFVNEAILTVGGLSNKLGWGKYNGVLSRYMKLGSIKSPQQKLYIRTVSAIIDNFHFDLLSDSTDVDVDMEAAAEVIEDQEDDAEVTVPAEAQKKKISEIVLNRLLPSLSKFVSQKDENEDSIRIPLALPTVKLAKQLPLDAASNEIIRVITIVSSILRSKDQDTRDIARDTMGKIAVFLGPDWLDRILAEMQTALQRGPQKHIAAVTTHSILVLATTEAAERFSDLDDSVNSAIRISAEVVWGESGKDAADEGYKTKMREVRGATSRGFDTFQLLSRLVSPAKISVILAPIREVMHASQAVKTMTQVDEALRRVALGLNANTRIQPEDILTLCYSLISGNSAYLKPKRKAAPTSQAPDAYRVEVKRNKKNDDDFYHLNAHKFVSFGLDLFVTAFRRGRFDFDNVDILSRLGPLVGAIGNTLYSPTASVLLLGLKASAAVARCPIPQVEEALPAFVSNIIKVIKQQGGSAETDIAQTALKTLSVILRDCKASTLTDTQLRYLLDIISPDLEETDRQAAIFAILRAIVQRRFVVPEIYDLMGSVSSIMVTSQSTHVQDQCRGLLMAFLLDYPQGKGRIKSQMTFLAQNLDYVYESGRLSVMEFLNLVFMKFTEELIQEYAELFFVALTAVIANDEVEKCRAMAGALLQQLVERLDAERKAKLVGVLKSWTDMRGSQPALGGAALAVFGLLAESDKLDQAVITDFIGLINTVIVDCAAVLNEAESNNSAFAVTELDYTAPHHALVALAKGLKAVPEAAGSIEWDGVIAHLLFPHDWVRLASARAIGSALAAQPNPLDSPALLDIARKGCILLQGSKTSDGEVAPTDAKLADQIVKLLWTIAKLWSTQEDAVNGNGAVLAGDEDHEADEDDAPVKGGSLAWLMSRMSFVARHIIVHRPSPNAVNYSSTHWTAPLMAILRFFAGVMEHLDVKHARRFMLHVLSPIYRVLDEGGDLASEAGPQIDDLKQLATEVRDFVQTKVGTTEFSKTWEGMRKRVSEKRDERRDARQQMAVRDPKAWAERKSKKVVIKQDSKKRRVKAFAEGRVQSKHMQRKRD